MLSVSLGLTLLEKHLETAGWEGGFSHLKAQ